MEKEKKRKEKREHPKTIRVDVCLCTHPGIVVCVFLLLLFFVCLLLLVFLLLFSSSFFIEILALLKSGILA